uniref:Uncharacterized protein n=1 Tax=Arundo donax TaxID=35708 RepID=A0A0A9FB79_ARUDO
MRSVVVYLANTGAEAGASGGSAPRVRAMASCRGCACCCASRP